MRKALTNFNAQAFLDSAGFSKQIVEYQAGAVVFSQGDEGHTVMHLQKGAVALSVQARTGREAILSRLGPGDFFGEECLAGQPLRRSRATATGPSRVLVIEQAEMARALHDQHALSDRFIAYMLSRNVRIEQDLIDQLINSSEKRLARALLLLGRYGTDSDEPQQIVPKISQESLADMIGTTRSRVNFFMKKFKRLGFIDYNTLDAGIQIRSSLLTVILQD